MPPATAEESEHFSSKGFDLDAPLNNEGTLEEIRDPKDVAEDLKAQGNALFQQKQYENAMDMYSRAIEALVKASSTTDEEDAVITGMELLGLRDEFEEDQRQKAYAREREEREARHSTSLADDDDGNNHAKKEASTAQQQQQQQQQQGKQKSMIQPYKAPSHKYSKQLAIYHSNRAAACANLIQAASSTAANANSSSTTTKNHSGYLEEGVCTRTTTFTYDDVIDDCDVALLHNPTYVKALIRRMSAYEKLDRLEDALQDVKLAVELEPNNVQAKRHAVRLQKLHDVKMEKLKEETIGKLKDLGNSLLSNFGLSLDNFQANQAQDGSYSISFNNGNK
mmetsp:Transcript_3903/g.5971  ORF Transcript_3903/g.5971 Transcript_3903/m.5971 type:complete len:337 (+) Transcript_3903:58-1068(+)